MDVNIINPFIASTKTIFSDMVHISLTAGKPYVKPVRERFHKLYRISTVIGMEGSCRGQLVLSMSEPVCLAISSGLLGEPITKVNADAYDAIAELANMIAGGAKKHMNSEKPITLTIPKIMLTENVTYLKGEPILIIPFDTSAGKLILQITMHEQPRQESLDLQPLESDESQAA
jgi:chemotaxis protein CheX